MRLLYLTPTASMGGAERVLLDLVGMVRQARPSWSLGLIVGNDGPLAVEARRHGALAEGFLAAGGGSLGPGGEAGMMAMANSRGFFHFHRTSRIRLQARVMAGGAAGVAECRPGLGQGCAGWIP